MKIYKIPKTQMRGVAKINNEWWLYRIEGNAVNPYRRANWWNLFTHRFANWLSRKKNGKDIIWKTTQKTTVTS